MANITKRVARGIQLLDETYGPNWRTFINLETLDLEDPDHCVLGQIAPEGGFWNQVEFLFSDDDDTEYDYEAVTRHGFADWDHKFSNEKLIKEWLRQLTTVNAS